MHKVGKQTMTKRAIYGVPEGFKIMERPLPEGGTEPKSKKPKIL